MVEKAADDTSCDIYYSSKEDSLFPSEKDCSIKTYTWSMGKGSQQLIWSLSSKSNMSTMQRNSNSLHKRFSSSHNSLSDSACKKIDDSIFITQAMSHDELDDNKILDFYNVPLDSDVYSAPVDFVSNHYNIETVLQKKKVCSSGNIPKKQPKRHQTQTKDSRKQIEKKKPQPSAAGNDQDNKRRSISNIACGCNSKKNYFSFNLKQKICNIFRMNKQHQYLRSRKIVHDCQAKQSECSTKSATVVESCRKENVLTRKLPPLPLSASDANPRDEIPDERNQCIRTPLKNESHVMDFTASIDKVKECGWYWGPISSEGAEKILSNEPDGSFLVRDSSDDHYIFSLTFKLNGSVRHVRIDQDQGAFSFGSCAKFKSHTIMEFIDNAVEHSRSGRYLFFLHRRPEHGPLRVQLTKPVSRFKHVQSLQHLCRFVIHKTIIRKDLIQMLPLPRRILDYLNYKNCLSERVEVDMISHIG
uniref:Suppressor of cytokine signaling 7 n=2 Tax=Culex pipiens TaxID=7175 RepID=A0A8D8E8B8_CULPI